MNDLESENRQVVYLTQALLGSVSPNFRAVSISWNDELVLVFLLEFDDVRDREEIEDIEFEFVALQEGRVEVTTRVVVSNAPLADVQLPGRLVYMRRET